MRQRLAHRGARCSATRRCSILDEPANGSTRRASAGCATCCANTPPRPDDPRLEPPPRRDRADRGRGRRSSITASFVASGGSRAASRGAIRWRPRAQPARRRGCRELLDAQGADVVEATGRADRLRGDGRGDRRAGGGQRHRPARARARARDTRAGLLRAAAESADQGNELVHAELLKLRTTPRTVLGLLLALLAIVVIGAVGTITSARRRLQPDAARRPVDVAGFADVVALILGVLVMTWEYRHDTITETFLVEPRRERVVGSKARGRDDHRCRARRGRRRARARRSPTCGSATSGVSFDSERLGARRAAWSRAPPSTGRSASASARSSAGRRSRSCSSSSGS